jgi:hypothetical protein
MGTPDFMAPEQALDFHEVDIRADIYSLGCTLFYLLTGQAPFEGTSLAQKLLNHQQAPPPSIEKLRPGLPPELAPVLGRMLAKRPEDRYQTPAEVAEALIGLSGSQSSRTEKSEPAGRDQNTTDRSTNFSRTKWVLAWSIGALLVILLVFSALLRRSGPPVSSSPTQERIDLLKFIHVDTDSVSGKWSFQGGTLISPTDQHARLQIAYQPPEEYDLNVLVERKQGNDSFVIGLIVGGRQCAVELDGWPRDGFRSGLENIDGKEAFNNETTHQGRVLSSGKLIPIQCSVRKTGVTVTVDGWTVVSYSGDATRLSMRKNWAVPNPRALLVGSYGCVYHITRLELLRPIGTAEPKAGDSIVNSTAPDLPASQGILANGGVRVFSSHVRDTLWELNDNHIPKGSNGGSTPRMTWWDHKGSSEWVSYRYPTERHISGCAVYWFDDTGSGECRVPDEWRLWWWAGAEWKPVKLTGGVRYGTALNDFNKITFESVTTRELKLEVKLRRDFSGGILKWTVVSVLPREPSTGESRKHDGLGYYLKRHPPEAVEFKGHWFAYYPGKFTWQQAKDRCQTLGGYLACVRNLEEQEFVLTLTTRKNAWLGGFTNDRKTWLWITGEPITEFYWCPGQPDNAPPAFLRLAPEDGPTMGPRCWHDAGHDEMANWPSGLRCEWDF